MYVSWVFVFIKLHHKKDFALFNSCSCKKNFSLLNPIVYVNLFRGQGRMVKPLRRGEYALPSIPETWEITCRMSPISQQHLIHHTNKGLMWRTAPALSKWAGLWDSQYIESWEKNQDFHSINYKWEIKLSGEKTVFHDETASCLQSASFFLFQDLRAACLVLDHQLIERILYPAHCT